MADRKPLDPYAARLFFDAEQRAERIAALVRVGVAGVLTLALVALIYGPARAVGGDVVSQLTTALLAICLFVAYGITTWWASSPRRFRAWMPRVFAALDGAFAVVVVAERLLSNDIPANYFTSMPPAWLIPVMLSLGALRYDPMVIRIQVAIIVVSLAVLFAFTGTLVVPEDPVGIDFVYQIPPNVIRLMMIISAGIILSIAVRRARNVLLQAIDETRRRAALTRYLPPKIADWIGGRSLDDARRGRRHDAAVLFVDIRGFTGRSETLEPQALAAFLDAFRARLGAVVAAHDGVIDKFVGDGAMVVFGVPEPAADDAVRAVQCVQAILREMHTWGHELATSGQVPVRVAIGLHFGQVFSGAVGDPSRLEFTVLGDTVNIAARLEALAKAGDHAAVTTRDTLVAAGSGTAGDWQPLDPVTLRGRSTPVDVCALVTT